MSIRKAQSSHWHQRVLLAAIFAVLGALAAFLLYGGKAREKQSVMMERTPTGTARLVSITPLAWSGWTVIEGGSNLPVPRTWTLLVAPWLLTYIN